MAKMNWPEIRDRLKEAAFVLPHFARNPIQFMRQLPEWDWPTMLLLQGVFAAACALLANIIDRNIIGIVTGIVVAPIANYILTVIGAGFFYYLFQFLFNREDILFRKVYLHVIFAGLPVMVVGIVTSLVPPLILLGAAATFLLLYVGFIENFGLEKRRLQRILGALMLIYAVYWAAQFASTVSYREQRRIKATPESIDILEKELGSG